MPVSGFEGATLEVLAAYPEGALYVSSCLAHSACMIVLCGCVYRGLDRRFQDPPMVKLDQEGLEI